MVQAAGQCGYKQLDSVAANSWIVWLQLDSMATNSWTVWLQTAGYNGNKQLDSAAAAG